MKHLLLLPLFFIVASPLFAQDIIHTKRGEKIECKVLEIGIKEARYKRTDNPNGPVYVILKRDITLIMYENGTQDLFQNLPVIGTNIIGLQGHAGLYGGGVSLTYERLNPDYSVGYRTRLSMSGYEESFIGLETSTPIYALGFDAKFYMNDNQPARFSYYAGGAIETGVSDYANLYFSLGVVQGFNFVLAPRVLVSVESYVTVNTISLALTFGATY